MGIKFIIITILMFSLGQLIQAISIDMLIGVLSKLFHSAPRIGQKSRFWHGFRILNIALIFLLINCLLQISAWAASFILAGQFSNYQEAFYHSAVNFASLGYGDIVMQAPWRLLGAMESISGILMLALSAATLSNIFTKLLQLRRKP